MYVLGVDIGTGSTKAVAVDSTGAALLSAQIPYPTLTPEPGASEQDPETLWDAFVRAVHRVTTALTEAPSAVCLSSAMHSVIPVGSDGKPLANLITWADNRSAEVARALRRSAMGTSLYAETGTPIHPMSPLCKIAWLKDEKPDLFARASRFISGKEYIWFRLFGEFEIDESVASATGLFDIHRRQWHGEALRFAGIDLSRLSIPVATSHIRKTLKPGLAQSLNLPPETPFVIGGSDGCMANIGSQATTPGVAALTIGTSGAIRVASPLPTIDAVQMPFNYILDSKTYITGGPINNGGIALKWFAQNLLARPLASAKDYDQLLSAAAAVAPGSDGLTFIPYLQGERAPVWDSEATGMFHGVTIAHRQEHFTRAVLEGICFSLYHIASGIESAGLPIDRIHVSGGFVRSSLWVDILCQIFGKKIVLMNNDDASAIGAAYLGMRALKVFDEYHPPRQREQQAFTPDPGVHAHYAGEFFPRYRALSALASHNVSAMRASVQES